MSVTPKQAERVRLMLEAEGNDLHPTKVRYWVQSLAGKHTDEEVAVYVRRALGLRPNLRAVDEGR